MDERDRRGLGSAGALSREGSSRGKANARKPVRWAQPIVVEEIPSPHVYIYNKNKRTIIYNKSKRYEHTAAGKSINLYDYAPGLTSNVMDRLRGAYEAYWNRTCTPVVRETGPLSSRVFVRIDTPRGRREYTALLDSGASRSVLKAKVFDELLATGIEASEDAPVLQFGGAFSQPQKGVGVGMIVQATVLPRRQAESVLLYRADLQIQVDMLLGQDFLNRAHAVLDSSLQVLE